MRKILITGLLFLLVVSSAFATQLKKVNEKVDIKDADKILLKGELGAGEFRINPENQREAFNADITYAPDHLKYWVNSITHSKKCVIEIGSERSNHHNMDSDENVWDIMLSNKYPIEIDLEIGACESDFELGGIPIEELSLDIGAADATISFSEKNPIKLKAIDIDAGACSFEMNSIGNANFETFKINGGAGSFDLDFRGEYKGLSTIDLDIGLGSANISLPKNIPVQIHTDGSNWLSSIDIHNNRLNQVKDNLYESDDFQDAEDKIILNVSVGMGSVDIRFRK